jgi:hypothetical protein
MGTLLNNTQFQYALKIVFPKGLNQAMYADELAPFMMLVRKETNGGGRYLSAPVEYGAANGRSGDIDKARANANGTKGVEFQLPWINDYAVFGVDRKAMKASQGNENAIVEAWVRQLESAKNRTKRSMGQSLFSAGHKAIGKITAVSGGQITLDVNGAFQLEAGDTVVSSTTTSGGSVDTGTGTVTSVNRVGATFKYTANASWSPQVNSYVFIDGDYNNCMAGLQAWLPTTAPVLTSDSFYGVDRGVDPTRLAGIRVDASSSGGGIIDALQYAQKDFRRQGVNLSHFFLSHDDFNQAEREAESRRVVYADLKGKDNEMDYGVGLKGLKIGSAVALPDMYCPPGKAMGLTLSTWTWKSIGPAPEIVEDDGLQMRRATTGDGFNGELAAYSNLKCEDPGQNGVVTLPTIG